MKNILGAIYTSPDIANLMANWAIRSAGDKVLDLGIGEGVFVYSCYERLIVLGATAGQAEGQIFGTEIDKSAFDSFKFHASRAGLSFPHIVNEDFFQPEFPLVDVVIGNPPYVRRRNMFTDQVGKIRESVLKTNLSIEPGALSRLTDLYIYFLLRALPLLKPEGRLAVLVADSWLNVRYGRALKRYLKEQFEIKRIVNFDQAIFTNAQVKPVLLFAARKFKPSVKSQVSFTRVMNGTPIDILPQLFGETEPELENVSTLSIPMADLDEEKPWGVHFKISETNRIFENNNWLVPINLIAHTRIGLQTLAKDFFVFSPEKVEKTRVETEFLEPFIYSLSGLNSLIVDTTSRLDQKLFFCSKAKHELKGTKALEYILDGECREVPVRGKEQTVVGYHNKDRIKKANRPNWYDVKTDVERRGRAQILIPRLIYRHYSVVWNKSEFVPGGTVIEFFPNDKNIDVRLFLAILNSTLMEIFIRGYAQMYGGGTYTVGLSQVKFTPILDVRRLNNSERDELINAYDAFVDTGNRNEIDMIIWDCLGLNGKKFRETVNDLRMLAISAKMRHG